jgi:hypothetical protein
MLTNLDIKNIKIGDFVIAIDISNTSNLLKLNKSYKIKEINNNHSGDYFFKLVEIDKYHFLIERFILNIKTIRKNKLSKLLAND